MAPTRTSGRDMDGLERADGVPTMGTMRSVCFSDPDGNLLDVETT